MMTVTSELPAMAAIEGGGDAKVIPATVKASNRMHSALSPSFFARDRSAPGTNSTWLGHKSPTPSDNWLEKYIVNSVHLLETDTDHEPNEMLDRDGIVGRAENMGYT